MHPIILVTSLFYMMMCNLVELLVSLVFCYCMFHLLEIIYAVSPSLYMDHLYEILYHTAYAIVEALSLLKVVVNDIYCTKIINHVFYNA